jgi:hypothetical protein
MAVGTLVWWRELRCFLGKNLIVNVVANARQSIAVDVFRVILWVVPREDLEEGA